MACMYLAGLWSFLLPTAPQAEATPFTMVVYMHHADCYSKNATSLAYMEITARFGTSWTENGCHH